MTAEQSQGTNIGGTARACQSAGPPRRPTTPVTSSSCSGAGFVYPGVTSLLASLRERVWHFRLKAYSGLPDAPQLAVFGTRLGLTVIDDADGTGQHDARALARTLISRVLASHDGYAALDVPNHPV